MFFNEALTHCANTFTHCLHNWHVLLTITWRAKTRLYALLIKKIAHITVLAVYVFYSWHTSDISGSIFILDINSRLYTLIA